MGDVLAFAEQRGGELRGVSHEIVSAASTLAASLGGAVHAVVLGGPGIAGAEAVGDFGAVRVLVGEHEALKQYVPEAYAEALASVVRGGDYAAVLFPATAQGKDLAPRVAALLDVPLACDATQLSAADGVVRVVRPVYSGKAFAHLRMEASPALVSLRPNIFPAENVGGTAAVESFVPEVGTPTTRILEFKAAAGGSVDVAEASVIVSGGRGMKEPENWHLLEELRDALGSDAALGASRAVVDAGWRPHAEQVGQTGKTVAPKLYFAVGISGAIQHLAGMRTSQTIVAINKDPDAPIFTVADFGVVGDALEILPRLSEEIRARKSD